MDIAIVGAGLVGRVLALNLVNKGHTIRLFDKDFAYGEEAAGMSAAGMLALFAELESAKSVIFEYGKRSIELWRELLKQIGIEDAYQQIGTIIVAHPQDYGELDHFIQMLKSKVEEAENIIPLDSSTIATYESDLAHHQKGFYIPDEGQVDAQKFMRASSDYLLEHPDITWHEEVRVDEIDEFKGAFDLVFDTRGVGAKCDLDDLRGVRGEVLWLESKDVNITRPTRMLHPRYKIYIVPREKNRYIIGATEIESDDKSPISLRSSLELLSAVYALHSNFAEARVIKCITNVRPTFDDNLPMVEREDNLVRINGLYRHGYLMAPAIVKECLEEIL